MVTIGNLNKEVQALYQVFVQARSAFSSILYQTLVRALFSSELVVGDYILVSLDGKIYKKGFVSPLTKNQLLELYENYSQLKEFIDSFLVGETLVN